MALRTYQCKECNHQEEILTDSKDEPREEPACEACGSKEMKKEENIESTSFQLNGKGWFKTGGY